MIQKTLILACLGLATLCLSGIQGVFALSKNIKNIQKEYNKLDENSHDVLKEIITSPYPIGTAEVLTRNFLYDHPKVKDELVTIDTQYVPKAEIDGLEWEDAHPNVSQSARSKGLNTEVKLKNKIDKAKETHLQNQIKELQESFYQSLKWAKNHPGKVGGAEDTLRTEWGKADHSKLEKEGREEAGIWQRYHGYDRKLEAEDLVKDAEYSEKSIGKEQSCIDKNNNFKKLQNYCNHDAGSGSNFSYTSDGGKVSGECPTANATCTTQDTNLKTMCDQYGGTFTLNVPVEPVDKKRHHIISPNIVGHKRDRNKNQTTGTCTIYDVTGGGDKSCCNKYSLYKANKKSEQEHMQMEPY